MEQSITTGETLAKDAAGAIARLPPNAVATGLSEVINLLDLAKGAAIGALQVVGQADTGAQNVVNTAAGDVQSQLEQLATHVQAAYASLKGLAAKGQAS